MDDDLLVGLALSKSIIEETNFFEDTFPTKPNKQNSAEQNEKIIETLFPKNSPSQFNSTPQFNESNLSKKYRNTTYGSLHKQQVTNVWKSSPPKVRENIVFFYKFLNINLKESTTSDRK